MLILTRRVGETVMIGPVPITLRAVVEATGKKGELALREHCRAREERDRSHA